MSLWASDKELMNTNSQNKPKTMLILFIILVCINWIFVIWTQYQTHTISSSWLTLLPLFAYFYFVMAIITCVELYQRRKLGMSLAYGVIMFGIICDVMSYSLFLTGEGYFELIIISLIALNFLLIFYMVCNQKYFNFE